MRLQHPFTKILGVGLIAALAGVLCSTVLGRWLAPSPLEPALSAAGGKLSPSSSRPSSRSARPSPPPPIHWSQPVRWDLSLPAQLLRRRVYLRPSRKCIDVYLVRLQRGRIHGKLLLHQRRHSFGFFLRRAQKQPGPFLLLSSIFFYPNGKPVGMVRLKKRRLRGWARGQLWRGGGVFLLSAEGVPSFYTYRELRPQKFLLPPSTLALQSYPHLLSNQRPRRFYRSNTADRLALAQTRRGDLLAIAAFECRRQRSRSLQLDEFSHILATLPLQDALNFDGGGSTKIAFRSHTGQLTTRASANRYLPAMLLLRLTAR